MTATLTAGTTAESMLLLTTILLAVRLAGGGIVVPQKELHIGGVFPMEAGSGGWPGGQACLPAVQMALDDVNGDPKVLPNYALRLHHHDSRCQPGLATKQLFELLYKPPVKLMLISGCSPVTTMFAESAPVWNLVVISYGGSSPALSNRARFPTLFRTHPSASMQNPTRVHLFERFKWKKITILQSVEEVFTSTAKDLENLGNQHGIRVDRQSFYGDPTDAVKDARIIVGLYYVTEARRVLCQAYQHGLYGRRYVWFLIGWYADTWYIPPPNEDINCTRQQMQAAAEYHFTTESVMLSRDEMPAISGITGRQFQQRLNKLIVDPANTGGYPEAPLAYDAVWALALALNCTQSSLPHGVRLEDFAYNNAIIADQLFACVKNTQFKGVSGQVMFSDSGDRIARTQIEQMQDGKYSVVGFYDTTTQTLEWVGNERFAGERGPPPDSTIIRRRLITLSLTLYIVVSVCCGIGLTAAFALFLFNHHNRRRRIIVQSLPQCNDLLIVGCALCLLGVLLMGLPADGAFPAHMFALLCHSRVTLLMLGFTFAYGALFAKVWIVHRRGTAESQVLQQQQQQQAQQHQRESRKEESSNSGCSVRHPTSAKSTLLQTQQQEQSEDVRPWESIRTLLAAMVGRQALVANAFRKISSTNAYIAREMTDATGGLQSKRSSCLLNQPIAAQRFYAVVGALVVADLLIVFVWVAVDPLQRQERTFELQAPPAETDEDVMFMPILELCQSSAQHFWTVLVFAYKALLLLFGVFLALETRGRKPRYVNDLRLILLAICNVSVLCLICAPVVVFLLRTQTDAFYAFASATVMLCTYISLGLVFVPKIIYIYKSRRHRRHNKTTPGDESRGGGGSTTNNHHQRGGQSTLSGSRLSSGNKAPLTAKGSSNASTGAGGRGSRRSWNSAGLGTSFSRLSSSSTTKKSEQICYNQLLKENAELKRQIEIRKAKIAECLRLLSARLPPEEAAAIAASAKASAANAAAAAASASATAATTAAVTVTSSGATSSSSTRVLVAKFCVAGNELSSSNNAYGSAGNNGGGSGYGSGGTNATVTADEGIASASTATTVAHYSSGDGGDGQVARNGSGASMGATMVAHAIDTVLGRRGNSQYRRTNGALATTDRDAGICCDFDTQETSYSSVSGNNESYGGEGGGVANRHLPITEKVTQIVTADLPSTSSTASEVLL